MCYIPPACILNTNLYSGLLRGVWMSELKSVVYIKRKEPPVLPITVSEMHFQPSILWSVRRLLIQLLMRTTLWSFITTVCVIWNVKVVHYLLSWGSHSCGGCGEVRRRQTLDLDEQNTLVSFLYRHYTETLNNKTINMFTFSGQPWDWWKGPQTSSSHEASFFIAVVSPCGL